MDYFVKFWKDHIIEKYLVSIIYVDMIKRYLNYKINYKINMSIDDMKKMGTISGEIMEGQKLARTLNIPTINLMIKENQCDEYELEPGVWAGLSKYNDEIWASCIYIHNVENSITKVEIHVLNIENFESKIGSTIECRLLHKVRDPLDFRSFDFDQIKSQLELDKNACIQFFHD